MPSSRPSLLSTPFLCRLGLGLLFAAILTACEREEIRVYSVPKEVSAPAERSANVQVPADWKEADPGQMLRSRYVIGGESGRAEVTVSAFPGDAGGVLNNINRWRGQLQIEPLSAEKLPGITSNLDVAGTAGTLVDMSGEKARMVAVIVPKGDQTWFFKLMGDDKIVQQQKDTFKAFVQSAARGND